MCIYIYNIAPGGRAVGGRSDGGGRSRQRQQRLGCGQMGSTLMGPLQSTAF